MIGNIFINNHETNYHQSSPHTCTLPFTYTYTHLHGIKSLARLSLQHHIIGTLAFHLLEWLRWLNAPPEIVWPHGKEWQKETQQRESIRV